MLLKTILMRMKNFCTNLISYGYMVLGTSKVKKNGPGFSKFIFIQGGAFFSFSFFLCQPCIVGNSCFELAGTLRVFIFLSFIFRDGRR